MKKSISFFLIVLFTSTVLFAQNHCGKNGEHRSRPPMPKVEELVSDLSTIQRHRLNKVTEESKKQVDKLQSELKNLRNQVRQLMEKEGDHSDEIFPLVDREGQLQAEITKEMYRCRIAIDEILTKEQLKEFRSQLESERQKMMKKGNTHKKGVKN